MTTDVGVIADRWRLYGLALGEGTRRLTHAVGGLALGVSAFGLRSGGRAPERLLIVPQDLRTTDPTVAADIYAGYFIFAGRLVEARGRSPFQAEPPTPAWAETLNGFIWLRHLRAADTALARANARALVADFLNQNGDRNGIGAEPRVVARRLISFLTQSPLILNGADHDFYRRFMRALARAVQQLLRALSTGLRGEDRLIAAIALAYAGLCMGPPRAMVRADLRLSEELDEQILPDGGHVGRSPRLLVELLADLLPLRQTYEARGMSPPCALVNAIDRMMPMLRLFRHGDGALALFNGMGSTQPDLIATLLAYDDIRATAIEHAPYAGYERLQAGRALVIADVGAPPPVIFSREAHAGCLSFEFSIGPQQIVVNCGAPRFGGPDAMFAARSTAAHSTATLADSSSCHFAGSGPADALGHRLGAWIGPAILNGPREVKATRHDADGAKALIAFHDGYAARFGIVHERRWRLDAGGEKLEGVDTFRRTGRGREPVPAALRFHLHPGIKASRSQGGQSAMLLLPDGEAWAFEAQAATIALEESVYFAAADGARRTEQIVVTLDIAETASIAWRLSRLGRTDGKAGKAKARHDDDEPTLV
jgi:uncharacterized heparinase superfamily protein